MCTYGRVHTINTMSWSHEVSRLPNMIYNGFLPSWMDTTLNGESLRIKVQQSYQEWLAVLNGPLQTSSPNIHFKVYCNKCLNISIYNNYALIYIVFIIYCTVQSFIMFNPSHQLIISVMWDFLIETRILAGQKQ